MARILAIIPARAGSKGLPGKNIRPFLGVPLLAWSIAVAKACAEVDHVAVSSDGDDVLALAREHGATAIKRPEVLASDTALPKDAVLHVLDTLAADGVEPFDLVVLLQPTSPLRVPEDISDCLASVTEQGADSAASFKPADSHPSRVWNINEGTPEPFMPGQDNWAPRQALSPAYALNGAVYVVTVKSFREEKSPAFLFGKSAASIMPAERSLDIDTLFDFEMAEAAAKLLNLQTPAKTGK